MTPQDEEARISAAVRREVEKMQRTFAKTMEKTMKDALKGIEKTRMQLENERKNVGKELDGAKKAREVAEKEGEKIVREYFEQRRTGLMEATRQEQLRQLTRMHLEAGKPVAEICHWLNVKRDFVDRIAELLKRLAGYRHSSTGKNPVIPGNNPRVLYGSSGRGGTMRFENNLTGFDMWWEFGGGASVALIGIPSAKFWEKETGIPLAERDITLQFIGEQVVSDQTGGCGSYIYDDQTMTIYGR